MRFQPTNTILVEPMPGVGEMELERLVGQFKNKRQLDTLNIWAFDLPGNRPAQAVEALLKNHPALKFAEVDQLVPGDWTPNDTNLGSQWHHTNINSFNAWDYSKGDDIIIAICDTGIDTDHPDFVSNRVAGYNYVANNTNVEDDHGHGTRTAGMAVAAGNDGTGISGSCPYGKLMAVKTADNTNYSFFSSISSGISFASNNGARVISNSTSGAWSSSSVRSAAATAVNTKQVLFLASAGNSGAAMSGTKVTEVITVGSTDSNNSRSSFSNYGPQLDMVAPGGSVYTSNLGGGYTTSSGTSFATPLTAGVVALMMKARPDLPVSDIRQILFNSCTDFGAAGRDDLYGYGMLNAEAAVLSALQYRRYRPSSDIVVSGWVGSPNSASLWENVNEILPDDADYVVSPDLLSSQESAVFNLSQATEVGLTNIRFRARRTGTAGQVRAVLLDASNTVLGTSAWQSLTSDFTTYTLAVSISAAASRVRLEVQ